MIDEIKNDIGVMNLIMKVVDKQTSLISIKIKTLNQSLYEVSVNLEQPVSVLQSKLQQKIGVPQNSQRLLFRGIMLEAKQLLKDYKLEEGNVLQLIANKIPSELSSRQSSIRRSEVARNNSYARQQFRYKRHRYLQQRLNGFRLKKRQSIEVLTQSKHTIDQLVSCLNFNIQNDRVPFNIQKRTLEVGEWVDVRDSSGEWAQGQIINHYGQYVLIHYNGCSDRWNEWIPSESDRIMPFRTFTVQSQNSQYLSPFPIFEREIPTKDNKKFNQDIQRFIQELPSTIDAVNKLIKQLEYEQKSQKQNSLKNVSNNSMSGLQRDHTKIINEVEVEKREQFETPSKDHHDNLSNKCEDNISNIGDNDDISNKSFKSKRSEGLVDTSSMKSLIIDQQIHKQNKIFFDCTEAQSVCSMKNKNHGRYRYLNNQQHILEEEDSQYNDQEPQERQLVRKVALQRKMKASQLAPLIDRMGRLMIDLAPHVAMMGHTQQLVSTFHNQNLSTFTNEGSLQSKLANLQQRNQQQQQVNSPSYCQFQIPVMLTPWEINRLNSLLQQQSQQNNLS